MKQQYFSKKTNIPTNLLILVFFLIYSFQINAQLAYQGFGGSTADNWSYTVTPAFYDLGNDYWHITTSTDNISADGTNGSFVGGEDLENANNATGSTQLTFDPIAISGMVTLSFRLQYIGYDLADFIHFEVVYDNGSSWTSPDYTNEINAIGVSGSSGGWIDVSHTIPSGNTHVRMRIDIFQNGSDEIGLDEFKIETSVLSTKDMILSNALSVFPNPFLDKLNVKISDSITVKGIKVYTVSGRLIKTLPANNKEIDLSGLVGGMYFLKIETDNGIITKKIIKN